MYGYLAALTRIRIDYPLHGDPFYWHFRFSGTIRPAYTRFSDGSILRHHSPPHIEIAKRYPVEGWCRIQDAQ